MEHIANTCISTVSANIYEFTDEDIDKGVKFYTANNLEETFLSTPEGHGLGNLGDQFGRMIGTSPGRGLCALRYVNFLLTGRLHSIKLVELWND